MAGHERLGNEPGDDEESESDSDEGASDLNWWKIGKKLATFGNNLRTMNKNYEQIRKENAEMKKSNSGSSTPAPTGKMKYLGK